MARVAPGQWLGLRAADLARYANLIATWARSPIAFVTGALGATPDPWQCDSLDTIATEDRIAVRACHGVGKTSLLAWLICWFLVTRRGSLVASTAPTFNKQVRDVLWAEVHRWWSRTERRAPWLFRSFLLNRVELRAKGHEADWFAVGIPSAKAGFLEGFHAQRLLVIIDEGKSIGTRTYQALEGTRTTEEVKIVVASTPGGRAGEFYNIFESEGHQRVWPHRFIIHPAARRQALGHPEAQGRHPKTGQVVLGRYARGGHYYSDRVSSKWVEDCKLLWGEESPVFIGRVDGEFPDSESDALIQHSWLRLAEHSAEGVPGPRWVGCDVARYGRDRTVFIVGEGGRILHAETVAKTAAETSARELYTVGVGDDPKRPRYRGEDVTADICRRLRRDFACEGIVIDDTGNQGVADFLVRAGERVIPVSFGGSPTDKPVDADAAEYRRWRHLLDSRFANIKAEMGWRLREAFQDGLISLAPLVVPGPDGAPDGSRRRAFLDALTAQGTRTQYVVGAHGKLSLIDPDEADDYVEAIGEAEGRRSPDHLHALMLYWYAIWRRGMLPAAGPAATMPEGVAKVGEPATQVGRIAAPGAVAPVGGQAAKIGGRYG